MFSAIVVLANYGMFTGADDKWQLCLNIISLFAVSAGGWCVFGEILRYFSRKELFRMGDSKSKNLDKWIFVGAAAIITVVDLCVLFGTQYPGTLTPDSIWQMSQVLTHTYSNHHPYYHTQIIHFLVWIGYHLFGNINAAVATYSVFSVGVMASCFAYVVYTIYQAAHNKWLTFGVFLYYLIMPFHIMYSITMWKDVFFGGIVTIFVVTWYRILRQIGKHQKLDWVIMLISALGMCVLRSNGLMAFGCSVIVFGILFGKKQRKMLLCFMGVIIVSFILKHPVLSALKVTQPDTIEALSIPAQQIARVVVNERELTDKQTELLSQVIDIEKISEEYLSFISDPVKELVREKDNQDYIGTHRLEFISLYVQLGLRYPADYIAAWIDQTKGYWNAGYDYWRWTSGVYKNSLGIERTVNSEHFSSLVGFCLYLWEHNSITQLFLSIGLYVWGIIFSTYMAIIKRKRVELFVAIPFLAVILSLLIATPVYAEFRYAYAIFCGMPFLLFTALFVTNQSFE